ncbi:MAG: hypothetical protein E7388_03660 [Ruminococcaceae bacterium]|nr:hypothetical protein [Oscillospiraceae bacterium]
MKKQLFAIIMTAVLLLCSIAPLATSAASIPNADGGGFDFYSVTVHYDQPTVLEYYQVSEKDSRKDKLVVSYSSTGRISYTSGWLFDEPTETYELRAGDKLGSKGTAYIFYQSQVLGQNGMKGNFFSMTQGDHVSNLYYSTFPSQYAYIQNIHDKDLLLGVDPVSLRGATEIVDDALNQNPNIEFGEDGYAKDVNGGRIDFNGYLLDESDNWYTIDSSGKIELCQLFKETSAGNLVPVSRFDENGKVIKVSKYDRALIYVVDENGVIAKDSQGNLRNATPVQGTPVMKTKIDKITVEIDALGDKIYDNAADDPQQKNTVTLSLGNTVDNIKTIPECGQIIGTAKCITTRTEAKFNKRVKPTVKSVEFDISDEILDSIAPTSSKLYIEFGVETIQGVKAYSSKYTMANVASAEKGFKTQEVKVLTEADRSKYVTETPAPTEEPSAMTSGGALIYIIIAAAAVVVIAVVIVIIILLGKKKKKSVAPEADVKEEQIAEVSEVETTEETVEDVVEETTESTEPSEE